MFKYFGCSERNAFAGDIRASGAWNGTKSGIK